MEYVSIGEELKVSRIGFGCAAMGGYDYGPVDDTESIRAVHAALDAGITLFDVADVYGFGHAESVLGRALRGKKAIIATKVGVRWDADTHGTSRDLSGAYITDAVEACLRRLHVDRLDICQLHWPSQNLSPVESLRPLARLVQQGKVGVVGVCNVDFDWLTEARSAWKVDTLQLPCNLLERDNLPILARASEEYGMITVAYNCLGHGLLTGKFARGSTFHPNDLRTRVAAFKGRALDDGLNMAEAVRLVADSLGRAPAQVALRWLLDSAGVSCVLAGVKTADQAIQNAASGGWTLPNELSAIINRVFEKVRGTTPVTTFPRTTSEGGYA